MIKQTHERCPRCAEERLRSWNDLAEEERMLARRLPGAAAFPASERESTHRWCTRCWYEETQGARHDA